MTSLVILRLSRTRVLNLVSTGAYTVGRRKPTAAHQNTHAETQQSLSVDVDAAPTRSDDADDPVRDDGGRRDPVCGRGERLVQHLIRAPKRLPRQQRLSTSLLSLAPRADIHTPDASCGLRRPRWRW
jgi:hypothetical protein